MIPLRLSEAAPLGLDFPLQTILIIITQLEQTALLLQKEEFLHLNSVFVLLVLKLRHQRFKPEVLLLELFDQAQLFIKLVLLLVEVFVVPTAARRVDCCGLFTTGLELDDLLLHETLLDLHVVLAVL